MKIKRVGLIGVAFLATVALTSQAYASNVVHIQAVTPYAKDAAVRGKVKDGCKLGSKLSKFIREFAKSYGIDVELSSGNLSKHSQGKVLITEITDVAAPGGGAWSGSKSMTVAGRLYDNGREIGDFRARRYSTGGMFAFYKSTCSIVGRNTKALGKDIAQWLQHPSHHASLGNL